MLLVSSHVLLYLLHTVVRMFFPYRLQHPLPVILLLFQKILKILLIPHMHRFLIVHSFKELADFFNFSFLPLRILFPLFCPLLVLLLEVLHVLALALCGNFLSLLLLLWLQFLEPALQVLLVLVLYLGFLSFHSWKEWLYSLWLLRVLSLVPVFGLFQCLNHHQRGIVLYPAHHLLLYIEGWGISKIP